jgi:hypothetical protein
VKLTVPPVGVGLTVAVYVTLLPTADGFNDELMAVVVTRLKVMPWATLAVEITIDPESGDAVYPGGAVTVKG